MPIGRRRGLRPKSACIICGSTNLDTMNLVPNIKCNPAIKAERRSRSVDRRAERSAYRCYCDRPCAAHGAEEKAAEAISDRRLALPLVQHALLTLFDLAADNQISVELIVDRACHAPAGYLRRRRNRGYVREGWFADLVIVDPEKAVSRGLHSNLLSKCQWSPFDGHEFSASIDTTIVNGESRLSRRKSHWDCGRPEARFRACSLSRRWKLVYFPCDVAMLAQN